MPDAGNSKMSKAWLLSFSLQTIKEDKHLNICQCSVESSGYKDVQTSRYIYRHHQWPGGRGNVLEEVTFELSLQRVGK